MSECLFVGGPQDGQVDAVADDRNNLVFGLYEGGENPVGTVSYRRVRFTAGKLTIPVFVAGMITDEMALKMLIDGYGVSDAT